MLESRFLYILHTKIVCFGTSAKLNDHIFTSHAGMTLLSGTTAFEGSPA
jgi:hypothetical protein